MQRTRRFIWLGAILASAFGIQAIGYAVHERAGDYALIASILLIVAAAWLVGEMFGRRLTLVAGISGGVIGVAYWFLDWHFMRLLRIHILHQFTEQNITWIAGLYALLMWPIVVMCAIAAAASAWRAGRSPTATQTVDGD